MKLQKGTFLTQLHSWFKIIIDPKKAASKRLNFIRVIEGESAARNAIEYIKN